MNIHEFQAKEILRDYGVNVLPGYVMSEKEALDVLFKKITTDVAVIKAQVHAGGRGKAGGVKLVKNVAEAREAVDAILGHPLVTKQTGPEGEMVHRVYIEEGCQISREFYLSAIVDREQSCVSMIASRHGGMDIEEVAEKTPDEIIRIGIDALVGVTDFQVQYVLKKLMLEQSDFSALRDLLNNLYRCFVEKDMSMLEINPLVYSEQGNLIALDAKMSFDENALFRHPDVVALKDEGQETENEKKAKGVGMSYVSLDGNIGCLVNGAGLAMATMDAIHYAGGSAANFLDVGGSASVEMVKTGFDIILTDPDVKGIFVNIFGGIMQCDTIAKGIIQAKSELEREIPIVVRLEGNNVTLGDQLLEESGLEIMTANSLDDGARKIVRKIVE